MEFTVVVDSEIDEVVRALRFLERSMPLDVHEQDADHADLLADVARREALGLPARGPEHSGIRIRMAKSVRSRKTRRGAEVVSETTPEFVAVFRGFDKPKAGWTHPVPRVRERVRQWPGDSDGWFREPLSASYLTDHLERAQTNVVERAIEFLDD